MEKERERATLGARLATRYVPKQILSSALSWGPLIGAEEVWRLERCFAERSITQDGDPAVTKEWLVHFIMEILEEKASAFACDSSLEDVPNSEVQPLSKEDLETYREEVTQWVSSFTVRLAVHDPLLDACSVSNMELAVLKGAPVESNNVSSTTHPGSSLFGVTESEIRIWRGFNSKRRAVVRSMRPESSLSFDPYRKEPGSQELVRWSDLTTNFVRDYEHFHRFDEDDLSFTRVRGELMSSSQSSGGKKASDAIWGERKQDMKNADADAPDSDEIHALSADCVLVAPLTGCIITGSKDGIVKMWDLKTGLFRRNLYNAGSSWVIGMFLILDEDYILIATSNNHLTVLNFPGGNVVQKYVGCSSLLTASSLVMQPSALHVQRYGMKPGECGTYRVTLQKGELAEHYHRRRREAQNDASSKNVPARPVVGFMNPTTCWFEPYSGIFFFGTASGKVGAFDISADVRPTALLAGANSKSLRLLFSIDIHVGAVVGIFYTSYAFSIFTAGADGCLYRTQLSPNSEPVGESRLVGHQSKPIRLMRWVPSSKYFITVHVNRRVLLWVIGRYGDPLRCFPPETQEVVSAALHPRWYWLVVLLSDKTIKVYEMHANRSIATIAQPVMDSKFTANDVLHQVMERSVHDEDGVVAWHPHRSCLISCLRAVVIYEPSRGHHDHHQHHSDGAIEDISPSPPKGGEHTTAIAGEAGKSPFEGDKLGQSMRSAPCVNDPKRMDSHRGGVVAMTVQRQTCSLHTFDEKNWKVWNIETGALKWHVDVPHLTRMENIPLKHATIASCSWTTSGQTRLATGTQDSTLLTWDPSTGVPLASEILVQDVAEQLDSDLSLMSHRNMLIAWCARTCRITTHNTGVVLPNGLEESKSVVIRVPSLASVTACCVIRDVYLCMGTADARIYFYSIRGGAPIYECSLRERSDDERGSVVQLIFLNEQNQNILIAILDIGVLYVYSYVKQAVLYRTRLVRRLESRIRNVLYIPEDGTIAYGDSMGCVRIIDVRGCTSTVSDFRLAIVPYASFCGATDEITSLEYFTASGKRYLVVGSLDCCVRLFQMDKNKKSDNDDDDDDGGDDDHAHDDNDSDDDDDDGGGGGEVNWSRPTSSSRTSRRSASALRVVFVGTFGREIWRLFDPTTFGASPPRAQRAPTASLNEEVLLESIVCSEVRPDSIKSAIETVIDDDGVLFCPRSRRGARNTPLSASIIPRTSQSMRPFFLTDLQHVQEDPNRLASLSLVGPVEDKRQMSLLSNRSPRTQPPVPLPFTPLQQQQQQQQQHQELHSPSPPEACNQISQSDDGALPQDTRGRHLQSRRKLCSVHGSASHDRDAVEQSPWLSGVDKMSGDLPGTNGDVQPSLVDFLVTQRTKMVLLGMARRLEAVQVKGHAKGEFLKKSNELLLKNGDALPESSRSSRTHQGSGELQQALEPHHQLAERIEMYKKQQELRRQKKSNTLPLVSARHHLTPVIIPQPSIIPTDVRAGYEWMLELPVTSAAEKPSTTSMRARDTFSQRE